MHKVSEIIFKKSEFENIYEQIGKQIGLLLETHNNCIIQDKGDRITISFANEHPISGEPAPYFLSPDEAQLVLEFNQMINSREVVKGFYINDQEC